MGHIRALNLDMVPFGKLIIQLLLPLLITLQFLFVISVWFRLVLRVRLMEFSSLLKGEILLAGLSDYVTLELSVRVVGMTAKRSTLLQKLEDVDHQTIIINIEIIALKKKN